MNDPSKGYLKIAHTAFLFSSVVSINGNLKCSPHTPILARAALGIIGLTSINNKREIGSKA